MKNVKARVRWWDSLKGEGVIRLNDSQKSIYVHYSAIDGSRQGQRVDLVEGENCVVDVIEDSHFTQISRVYKE